MTPTHRLDPDVREDLDRRLRESDFTTLAKMSAFSVAAAMPAALLQELRTLIALAIARGDSFDEFITAVQPLLQQIAVPAPPHSLIN